MTNSTTSVDDLGFATLLDETPLAPAHRTIALDAASLDDYIGDYTLSDAMSIDVSRKDNQLYAQATGQGAFPIFADSMDEFFAKVADIRISFSRDASRKISGLVLHQNGDHAAPKIRAQVASDSNLSGYVGRYRLTQEIEIDVTVKDERLLIQLTGQPVFPVYASAADKFFLRVVDAQFDFERDASGRIIAVVLHQNGQNLRAERIRPS
jgi:serine-type D-Ala-D-Ala carboxypeptidase/endopeptidase